VYWLLTENYVLNANILVFMLIHTGLFSNVSGLGLILIHCGFGLEKILGLGLTLSDLGLGLMPSWPLLTSLQLQDSTPARPCLRDTSAGNAKMN